MNPRDVCKCVTWSRLQSLTGYGGIVDTCYRCGGDVNKLKRLTSEPDANTAKFVAPATGD